MIHLGEHIWYTLCSVAACMVGIEKCLFGERRTKETKLHVSLGSWDCFVEDIQEVFTELALECFVVLAAVLYGLILPFFKPLPKSIGDENAVADTRESLLPSWIFGARKSTLRVCESHCNGKRLATYM